jgi:hypothetical protein
MDLYLTYSLKLIKNGTAFALVPCPVPSTSNGTMLQRLLEGYRNFQSSQKSLYTVMYPDNIFASETVNYFQLFDESTLFF